MGDDKNTGDPARRTGRGKQSGTGSFAGTQHGGSNDGVTSAKPQAVTGTQDATFETGPAKNEREKG